MASSLARVGSTMARCKTAMSVKWSHLRIGGVQNMGAVKMFPVPAIHESIAFEIHFHNVKGIAAEGCNIDTTYFSKHKKESETCAQYSVPPACT